jgi:tRNA threonylcarbamoyladenosine biosynthesis protein TsaE
VSAPPLERRATTDGPAATRRLAARLGALALPGDVVALAGGLGAGKTCFVQGLARGLGVRGPVASPTFNIVLAHAGAHLVLYHVDLYRIASPGELDEIGLETYLYGDGVCAVEWMDRFPALAPAARIDVALAMTGGDPRRRTLTARGHGERGRALVAAWLAAEP